MKPQMAAIDDVRRAALSTITGTAQVVTERDVLQEIWGTNPLLRSYLGTIDNPEFLLYRVVPAQVRFVRERALEYHDVPL